MTVLFAVKVAKSWSGYARKFVNARTRKPTGHGHRRQRAPWAPLDAFSHRCKEGAEVEVKVGGGWCAKRGSQRKRNENEIKKRNFYNFRTKISATHWQDTCVLVASFTLLPRPQRATSWAYVSKFSALLVCGFVTALFCSTVCFCCLLTKKGSPLALFPGILTTCDRRI